MILNSIKLKNITVFEDVTMDFSEGINVFVGENATGKTHLLKILYAASKSNRVDIDFAYKLVRCLMPDDMKISRLLTKNVGNQSGEIKVTAYTDDGSREKTLSLSFDKKTKKWNSDTKGKEAWEKAFPEITGIFIPAKEILSHSYKLEAAANLDNVRFDDTYIDIISSAKIDINKGKNPLSRSKLLNKINEMLNGQISYDAARDEFYLKKGSSKQEFSMVAEGVKKMGLLWQLAKNGTLERGSILFWDEPEANINPQNLSTITELLLELQRSGVQIFISTHSYFLAKYLDIKKKVNDRMSFCSLFKESQKNGVSFEKSESFSMLQNNAIIETYLRIYRDELGI